MSFSRVARARCITSLVSSTQGEHRQENRPEANALEVVRSTDNRSVIAGPGTGKTELLAQRATYLLQTGLAPAPQRILAISFKRDAATNLAARVRQRCHRSHAGRFDSLIFDAFAKGLVDRFGQVLPERWRPRPDYEIFQTSDAIYRGFLQQQVDDPPPQRWRLVALCRDENQESLSIGNHA
jgi:superfamily I DNA/RNA helicase